MVGRAEEAGNQSFRLQACRLSTRLPLPVPAALLPQPLNLKVFLIDGGGKKKRENRQFRPMWPWREYKVAPCLFARPGWRRIKRHGEKIEAHS